MSTTTRLPFSRYIKQKLLANRHKNSTYDTYQEALAQCQGLGYDCADIACSVVAKTELYRDQISRSDAEPKLDLTSAFSLASMSLAASHNSVLRVLDFGGAAGMHYFLTRQLIPKTIQIQWVVVETSTMVEIAQPKLSTEELCFSTDISEAASRLGTIDIVHSSGAIQYVPDPCVLVADFARFNAKYLLLNRIGVTTNKLNLFATHQSRLQDHGPGRGVRGAADRIVRTPYVFASESNLLSSIASGYKITAKIDDPSGIMVIPNEPIRGIGLLAARR